MANTWVPRYVARMWHAPGCPRLRNAYLTRFTVGPPTGSMASATGQGGAPRRTNGGPEITLSLAEDLPDVIADSAWLTRILASLTAEALHRSPAGTPPALSAVSQSGTVTIMLPA